MSNSVSYYSILGVEPTATQQEIKTAYRRAQRAVHPDMAGASSGDVSSHLFTLVTSAYEVLSDETRRAQYDESLKGTTKADSTQSEPTYEDWGSEQDWDDEEESEEAVSPLPHRFETVFHPNSSPQSNSWYSQVSPKPVRFTPARIRARGAALVSSVAAGLALVPLVTAFFGEDTQSLAWAVLSVFAFSAFLLAAYIFSQGGIKRFGTFVTLASIFTLLMALTAPLAGLYVGALSATTAGAAYLWRRFFIRRGRGSSSLVAMERIRDFNVFGTPHTYNESLANNYSASSAAQHLTYRTQVARALEETFSFVPGIRIFHGIMMTQDTFVQSAVVLGSRVALITLADYQVESVRVEVDRMVSHAAASNLKTASVKFWNLSSTDFSNNSVGVSKAVTDDIGNWLLDGQDNVVDRQVMSDLLRVTL